MAILKSFECYIAVTYNKEAVIINFPTDLIDTLDGCFCEDNDFINLPQDPGVYKCKIDFDFEQGYFEGYKADGENTWEYIITNCQKIYLG